MGRHIHLQPHLPVVELERRYRAAKEPHERSWWQILWLLAQGWTATELAGGDQLFGVLDRPSCQALQRAGPCWHAQPAAHDLAARGAAAARGATGGATPSVGRTRPEDDRWSGRTVAEWMSARLGHPVSRYCGWVYLQRLRPQPRHGLPRPRHALGDPAEQETSKKS